MQKILHLSLLIAFITAPSLYGMEQSLIQSFDNTRLNKTESDTLDLRSASYEDISQDKSLWIDINDTNPEQQEERAEALNLLKKGQYTALFERLKTTRIKTTHDNYYPIIAIAQAIHAFEPDVFNRVHYELHLQNDIQKKEEEREKIKSYVQQFDDVCIQYQIPTYDAIIQKEKKRKLAFKCYGWPYSTGSYNISLRENLQDKDTNMGTMIRQLIKDENTQDVLSGVSKSIERGIKRGISTLSDYYVTAFVLEELLQENAPPSQENLDFAKLYADETMVKLAEHYGVNSKKEYSFEEHDHHRTLPLRITVLLQIPDDKADLHDCVLPLTLANELPNPAFLAFLTKKTMLDGTVIYETQELFEKIKKIILSNVTDESAQEYLQQKNLFPDREENRSFKQQCDIAWYKAKALQWMVPPGF